MSNSMVHWNGNQLCVVDIETTGLDPFWHELIQICILPLDSNIQPRKDVLPFYIEVMPEFPERRDPEAMSVSNLNLATIMARGHDKEKAKDLLTLWMDKLGLPLNKGGIRRCQIIPIGHNYAFDRAFIINWLGYSLYNEYFHGCYRDTMVIASYLNDKAGTHAEKVPYSKVKLSWLANLMDLPIERAHDALSDCVTTAALYRKFVSQGLMGL